jgi:hypothetical protein
VQGIADEDRLRGRDAERVERMLEDLRGRFRAPNIDRIDEDTKQGTNTGIVAHLREVSVEVGDDAELVAAGEIAKQRRILLEGRERVGAEPPRHPRGDGVVGKLERLRDAGGETVDRRLERRRRGQRADQRVVRGVEGGIEALTAHRGALVAEQAKRPLLPGKPVGVQGPAEVEQYGCSVVRGQRRVSVVEIWWRRWESNPRPETLSRRRLRR